MSNLSEYISRISLAIGGNTTGTLQTVGNGTFVLAGGPNVTLSQSGRTVTVSANAGGGGGVAASAGTQLLTSGTLSFADSNGITWGLNNGTITASYTVPPSIQAALNTNGNTAGVMATVSTGTLILAGGNQITLSQDGNSVTISGPAQFFGGVSNLGNTAGSTTVVNRRMALVGSNNITLSQSSNGASVTVSIIGPTTSPETPFGISAGTQSVSTGTMVFSNSNNVTFGMSGSSRITASASFPAETPFGVSAGTQSVSTGTLVFSNSNNVTFGMSGSSRVTASASFPAETPFGISAGTQSVSTGTMVFSDSNGISFGMSGSNRITASYTVPTVPAQFTGGFSTGGNTLGDTGLVTGRLVLAGGPNITLSGSTNAGSITVSISGGAGAAGNTGSISAGTTRATLGEVVFSNSNNVSFGVNGQTVTATVTVAPVFSAGLTTFGQTAGISGLVSNQIVFAGLNRLTVSQSVNGGSATITIAQQNQAHGVSTGGNTAGDTGVNNYDRVAWAGGNNITLSQSTNGNSATITISGPTQSNQQMTLFATGNTTLSSTGTTNASSVIFRGSGAASVGITNGSVLIDVAAGGAGFSAGVSTAGNTAGSTGVTGTQLVFVGTSNMTLSQSTDANGGTITFIPPGGFSAGISGGNTVGDTGTVSRRVVFAGGNNITLSGATGAGSQTITISAANQSNQQMTLFATGNTVLSSTGTTNASSMIFRGSGAASVGITNGSVLIDVPAGGGAGFSAGVSTGGNTAGSTGVTGTRLVLVGDTGVILSQSTDANGGTVSIVRSYKTFQYTDNLGGNIQTRNFVSNLTALNSRPIFLPIPVQDAYLQAGNLNVQLSRSTSGSNLFTFAVGVYTRVNSTQLSLWQSTSQTYSATATASISGVRILNLDLNSFGTSLWPPNDYVIGINFFAANSASMNYSIYGAATAAPPVGFMAVGANNNFTATSQLSSIGISRFAGLYNSTTTAWPASIAFTQIQQWTTGGRPMVIIRD